MFCDIQQKNKSIILNMLPMLFVSLGFLIAIFFPYYFQYTGAYFGPSVINGINIFEYGRLVDSSSMHLALRRLASDLTIEESYPLPGILTATLLAVTGLPYEKIAYLPIVGITTLIYYILGKYLLSDRGSGSGYIVLLSLLYFYLVLTSRINGLTTGRAGLGISFLAFYIYSHLRLIESQGFKIFPWLLICLLTTAMAGGTYYTATLAIIIIGIISFIVTYMKLGFNSSTVFCLPRGLSILILALFLFFLPPILSSITPDLNSHKILINILDAIRSKLGFESSEASKLYGNYLENNFLTQMRLWSSRMIIILSFICIILIALRGFIKSEYRFSRQWLYAIIVAGVCCSELPYIFEVPIIPTRFLVMYGFLCTLYIVFLSERRKILSFAMIILVTIVFVSNLSFGLKRGGFDAKPFSIRKVQPVADYLNRNLSTGSIVAADACYSSNLWLLFAGSHKNSEVAIIPIGRETLLLKEVQDGFTLSLVNFFKQRNIEYLLINIDGMPFYGDTWGYAVKLNPDKWLHASPFDWVFNDGHFILCSVKNKIK